MLKHLLFISITLGQFTSFSQDTVVLSPIAQNTIYLEAFGQGLYNSLSYDRILFPEFNVKHSATVGLTFIPPISYMQVVALPVSYNFIFGQKSHHLELGVGFTSMIFKEIGLLSSYYTTDQMGNLTLVTEEVDQINLFFYFTPKIGYRFQKPTGGFFFRATLTPPVAGLNIWNYQTSGTFQNGSYTEVFRNVAFFEGRIFPWAGLSFGYSFY